MNNSAEVIKMLKAVGLEAHRLLEKTPQLQLVTKHGIQQLISRLQPSAGVPLDDSGAATVAAGKPQSIAGRKINWTSGSDAKLKAAQTIGKNIGAVVDGIKELAIAANNQVEEAYQEFIGGSSSETLKKTLPDLMIRAVAAKVGFNEVTATEPKTIPLRLVAEIKAKAIEMQETIDANNKAMGMAKTGKEITATAAEQTAEEPAL